MGLSRSDREYPMLTGRSGMQRARRCPVTARTVQGMAPYPGRARCLALGFWPECFWRLDVKGGRRPFPEETRIALDIEGKHVTIQGPSPDLSPAMPYALSTGCEDLQIRSSMCGHPDLFRSVRDLGFVPAPLFVLIRMPERLSVRVAPTVAPK